MKLALLGAFLFLMSFAAVMYCITIDNQIAILLSPFMASIILIPIGLSGEEDFVRNR